MGPALVVSLIAASVCWLAPSRVGFEKAPPPLDPVLNSPNSLTRPTYLPRSEDDPSKNILYVTLNVPELNDDYSLTINGNKLDFKGATHPPQAGGTASTVGSTPVYSNQTG